MRLVFCLLVSCLLLLSINTSVFAEEAAEEKASLPVAPVLKKSVLLLIAKDEINKPTLEYIAQQENKGFKGNAAEQYLFKVLKGAKLYYQKDYQAAIDELSTTEKLADALTKAQENSEEFRQLHLLLAKSYAAIGDYDHGFQEKRKYLVRLFDDREAKDNERIEALNEKFQLEQKNKAKQLLEEQSRLKKLQISKAQEKKSNRERDTVILIFVFIVLALLMARQIQLSRRLVKLNQVDSLTSVNSRTRFFEQGSLIFEQAKLHDQPLSVIIVDLDNFNQVINDFGHEDANQVLVEIAQLVKESMRSRDVLARLGGKEFIALLPSASLEAANAIAVRLNDKIVQASIKVSDAAAPQMVSIGLSSRNESMLVIADLVKQAEQSVAKAKESGGGVVVTSNGVTDK